MWKVFVGFFLTPVAAVGGAVALATGGFVRADDGGAGNPWQQACTVDAVALLESAAAGEAGQLELAALRALRPACAERGWQLPDVAPKSQALAPSEPEPAVTRTAAPAMALAVVPSAPPAPPVPTTAAATTQGAPAGQASGAGGQSWGHGGDEHDEEEHEEEDEEDHEDDGHDD